jgi:SAM-dependent methyltransferase
MRPVRGQATFGGDDIGLAVDGTSTKQVRGHPSSPASDTPRHRTKKWGRRQGYCAGEVGRDVTTQLQISPSRDSEASAGASAYDVLAREYYDPAHMTSRNFDAITATVMVSFRSQVPDGLVLEPGCGRGRSGEFLGVDAARVVQLDHSSGMLGLLPREESLLRVLHDAESLPFPEATFSCVTAFLCDPFLGLNFLWEAHRVLKPGGLLVGTTPSYGWGQPLRSSLGLDTLTTRFALRDGRHVIAPSLLHPIDSLASMLTAAGFREETITVQSHCLPDGANPVSPDITAVASQRGMDPYTLGVLDVFTASA